MIMKVLVSLFIWELSLSMVLLFFFFLENLSLIGKQSVIWRAAIYRTNETSQQNADKAG